MFKYKVLGTRAQTHLEKYLEETQGTLNIK